MKIAITSDIYYPMTNGVAVFAYNLARGLAKKGHKVLVICPSFTGKRYKEKRDGVTTFYLSSVRFPFYPDQINEVPKRKEVLGVPMPRLGYRYGLWWAAPAPYSEMKKALDKFKPDVIHNQTAEPVAIAARTYARRYNIPLVTTGHAYPDNITDQFRILKPIKKPLNAMLKAYMASFLKHSEYATMPTEMAIDDLVPKNRKRFKTAVEPLSNGVDLSQFKAGKASDKIYHRFRIPKNRPIVLYVGRVDPEKSIETVVEAFSLVLESIPDALLVIVGDGTAKVRLMELAKALEIENSVKFLGRVLPPVLNELYRVGDVFTTASETETQGIVLIEAAATGLPIVAVDAGAVRELCQHKRNGILCKPGGDVEGIAAGLIKILNDKKLAKAYSKESLAIAKKHDLNRTLERFIEIYQEAIRLKRLKSE